MTVDRCANTDNRELTVKAVNFPDVNKHTVVNNKHAVQISAL